jgi:aspartate-semialdehyde dehydrogenase
MKLIIIGATGLVGNELLKLLDKVNLSSFEKVELIASQFSKGKVINFQGNKLLVQTWENIDFSEKNIFINCSSSELALKICKEIENTDSILIDNSSALRLEPKIPLVVPHINYPKSKNNLFANPNCSTIILSCLLNPIKNFGFERIIVSTYQAASGAGKEGLEELELQMKEYSNKEKLTTNFWKRQYVNNCFVHNSSLTDKHYNTEEMKLINETKKIFNDSKLRITSTCIRVPTVRSHCESVNVEFKNAITYQEIIALLESDENIILLDDKKNCNFPDTIISSNKNEVFVGHIRPDYSLPENIGWHFWISGDQILRGAAYNAIEILKKNII